MSYFSKFNYVNYYFPDNKNRLFKNLSTRLDLLDKVKNDNTVFTNYYVKDGETPDIVSFKEYERSDYHWCILLVNNIVNIYSQWPKTNQQLEDYLVEKYKSQKTQSGTTVTLSRTATLEFINFVGLPATNYEDSDGTHGVIYRPRHFVDSNDDIYNYDSIIGEYKDAFGRPAIRPTLTPVSYFTHEFNINEQNRNIVLPSSNLIQQMERELRVLLSE